MSVDEEVIKKRGFFWKSASLYGELSKGFYDYGNIGTKIKKNIETIWRDFFVYEEDAYELAGSVLLPERVFKASGHIDNFKDPIVQCKKCHSFFRADKLIEEKIKKPLPENLSLEEYDRLLKEYSIVCPKCKTPLEGTKKFNLLLPVKVGPTQDKTYYLRGETCQNMFSSFNMIFLSSRGKLPVKVAQIGKSFRNEISPRNQLIRLRELNQMELEVFFDPSFDIEETKYGEIEIYYEEDGKKELIKAKDLYERGIVEKLLFVHYLGKVQAFFEEIGFPKEKTRFRKLSDEEKAFYAKYAFDFEVLTSLGWIEVVANNYRQDYDLKRHFEFSGKKKEDVPHVWEVSMGLDRIIYTLLDISFKEIDGRKVLSLPKHVAPYLVAVFPIVAKEEFVKISKEIINLLKKHKIWFIYEEKGSIGKRYARADEIGIPFCITIDGQTLEDNTVTIRERDTKKQKRIKIEEILSVL